MKRAVSRCSGGGCTMMKRRMLSCRCTSRFRESMLFPSLNPNASLLCARRQFRCTHHCLTSALESPPGVEQNAPRHGQEESSVTRGVVGRTEQCVRDIASAMSSVLQDRRARYSDAIVKETFVPHRRNISRILADLFNARAEGSDLEAISPLLKRLSVPLDENQGDRVLSERTFTQGIAAAKRVFLAAAQPEAGAKTIDEVRTIVCFYAALLSSSGLVQTEEEIRLILNEMKTVDLIEPTVEVYQAILCSLLFVNLSEPPQSVAAGAASGNEGAAGEGDDSSAEKESVLGQERLLSRAAACDRAGYYFGAALHQQQQAAAHQASSPLVYVNDELWATYFSLCALGEASPKLMDLWWAKFLEWVDGESGTGPDDVSAVDGAIFESEETSTPSSSVGQPLPLAATYSLLCWASQEGDVERVMKVFHTADKRGVRLSTKGDVLPPGCLTTPVALQPPDDALEIQSIQLQFLAKLMLTVKSVQFDGGVRAMVVRDVKQLLSPEAVLTAPWGILNDLLSGLSVASAMQLLKERSRRDGRDKEGRENSSGQSSGAIPFFIWAALLRRCAHEQYVEEAESLFLFVRKSFPLTSLEKRELVEVMMRMYASFSPPDFTGAIHIFTEHVLQAPTNEPVVDVDSTLYNILIKAADSRNAAMMIFLESCAAGAGMNIETFEGLVQTNRLTSLHSLSRKLPSQYPASALDSQLRIPADVDAHLRREEALRERGKPLYDSTGGDY